jgi:predicted anti-sigma-YlaC factor YlaD
MPEIALHLDHCPDCREWYETLLAFNRGDSPPTE